MAAKSCEKLKDGIASGGSASASQQVPSSSGPSSGSDNSSTASKCTSDSENLMAGTLRAKRQIEVAFGLEDDDMDEIVFPGGGKLSPAVHGEEPFIHAVHPDHDYDAPGKWMYFYPRSKIEEKWKAACDLYLSGRLPGIGQMKVSTTYAKPRASGKTMSMFYCGPPTDKAKVMEIGKSLIKVFPPARLPIYYKSDEQTYAGTKATGQKKNHLYKLPE